MNTEENVSRDSADGESPVDAPDAPGPATAGDSPGAPPSPDAASNDGADGEPTIESLTEQLETTREEARSNWERCLRTAAELDNVRKRAARDVENANKFALERFARELLAVRDSLEMGIAAAADNPDLAAHIEGSTMTLKTFDQVLDKFGVVAIDPMGETFDPEQHEAMAMREADGVEPGTVLDVVQKGFALNGRLLRAARVFVAQ